MPVAAQQTSSDSIVDPQDVDEEVEGHARRGHSMEVEQAPQAPPWTPVSSPHVRSHRSEVSSNSVGSSLDTASASAHLERYDMPWSTYDVNAMYRGQGPRRSRSYTAFLEWNVMNPVGRHQFKSIRPLGGASRRRLIRQIQQLTKDKADLQAQLAVLASGHPASLKLVASKVVDPSPAAAPQKKSDSSVDSIYGSDEPDGIETHSTDQSSSQGVAVNSTRPSLQYPPIEGLHLEMQQADGDVR